MPPPIPSQAPTLASPPVPVGGTSAGGGHQFVVRYYRRMKPQRVYRLVVELRSLSKKAPSATAATADPVQVRPLIPGCFISPAELAVSPKASANRVTFYVTPLAKGRLRDAQIGIYHQNRLLQDVRLRMKSATQCLTRWLLVLTIAAPLLVWWATSYLDLSGMDPNEAKAPASGIQKEDKPKPPEELALNADVPADAKEPPTETERKEPAAATKKASSPLEEAIVRYVPEYPGETYTQQAAAKVQEGYNVLRAKQQKEHLSFWVFVAFLSLTLLSLVTHRQARGKRKGKPLTLPAPATTPDFGGSDALSFNLPAHPLR